MLECLEEAFFLDPKTIQAIKDGKKSAKEGLKRDAQTLKKNLMDLDVEEGKAEFAKQSLIRLIGYCERVSPQVMRYSITQRSKALKAICNFLRDAELGPDDDQDRFASQPPVQMLNSKGKPYKRG